MLGGVSTDVLILCVMVVAAVAFLVWVNLNVA